MARKLPLYNSSNIKSKIDNFIEQGIDVLYSVTFCNGRHKEKLIDKAPHTKYALLARNVKCDPPEKLRVELFDSKDNPTPIWFNDYIVEPEKFETEVTQTKHDFKGFGEAEINNLVDQRFREKQQAEEFNSMKEQVTTLTKELEAQTQLVEELEEENERLQSELESKSQMRYYAGMLGDILEGIGISKDKIRKPIASLMGIDEESDTKQINHQQAKQTDSSGIVEDDEPQSTDDEKRNEVITLISDYIKNTSNQTLGNLFIIFSEIEQNPEIADKILQFLQSQNQ